MTSTDTTVDDEGELPRRLRRMVNLRGLSRISAELGISRESLARYLARIDVQAATRALIESKLSAPSCPRCGSTDRSFRAIVDREACPSLWHDERKAGGDNALPG